MHVNHRWTDGIVFVEGGKQKMSGGFSWVCSAAVDQGGILVPGHSELCKLEEESWNGHDIQQVANVDAWGVV